MEEKPTFASTRPSQQSLPSLGNQQIGAVLVYEGQFSDLSLV